jgi:hypothetical protein
MGVKDSPAVGSRDGLPEVFQVEQIAVLLGCSKRTLIEQVRRHGCFRKLGNTIFLTRQDLDSLLESLKPTTKVSHIPRPRKVNAKSTQFSAPTPKRPTVPEQPPIVPVKFLRTKDDD